MSPVLLVSKTFIFIRWEACLSSTAKQFPLAIRMQSDVRRQQWGIMWDEWVPQWEACWHLQQKKHDHQSSCWTGKENYDSNRFLFFLSRQDHFPNCLLCLECTRIILGSLFLGESAA